MMDLIVILGAHVKRYSLDIYKTCWDLQLKYLGGDCVPATSFPSLFSLEQLHVNPVLQ